MTLRRMLPAICLALALPLAGCEEERTPAPTLTATPAATAQTTNLTPTITPTPPFPTAAPITLVIYRHRSGVFSIPRPADWDVIDDSTEQRLLVLFIPPVGFGSRISIEVTSPGALTPDEMHGEVESYITRNYQNNPAYREASRKDLPDGRFQVVFQYNDGRGITGVETLTAQQAGNFFVVLKTFLADADKKTLSSVMDSVITNLNVEARASWGTAVGAINPAELVVVNTLYWKASSDHSYFMGEVYNASPADITNIQVKISVCDQSGAIIREMAQSATLKTMVKGGTVPFIFGFDKPPKGQTVCGQSATADPAQPDSSYTTSLGVKLTTRPRGGFTLGVEGQVTNPGLSPVKNVHVVIVVYDDKNTVVGLTEIRSAPDKQFQPGEGMPLRYTFETLGGKPDHVAALVEADVIVPSSPLLNP